ncbi:chemotaxis protein CheB [Segetibacter koreensis]|uniref:chemotaxis protein CheB n=1 Tax=Segetibacter koreensis TaxID=398037 RepID=UPI0003676225|nr:chemotaxis protein CheB [Segetibacter koreensis]
MSFKFVVAIGYSEGGLEPLQIFFNHVPHDEATYIILRHIPIGQRGALSEILQKHSKLRILEAENGMLIENDKVYIPPASSYMTIKNDKLYLRSRVTENRNYNYSVDVFLESLARANSVRSIAVILSGGGFDGAKGALLIHEAGGMVIAQTPASCTRPEMPQNAIDNNCVDQILSASAMPDAILQHINPILKNFNQVRRLME